MNCCMPWEYSIGVPSKGTTLGNLEIVLVHFADSGVLGGPEVQRRWQAETWFSSFQCWGRNLTL